MVILGFMLNYALRVNLTIAIVAMVEPIVKNVINGAQNTTIAEALISNGTIEMNTLVSYFIYFKNIYNWNTIIY